MTGGWDDEDWDQDDEPAPVVEAAVGGWERVEQLAPTATDTEERAPRPCKRCGVERDWVWIAEMGFFVAPPLLCAACRDLENGEAEQLRRADALQRAGIPERYRGWSFGRTAYQDGLPHEWRSRMGARIADGERVIGILSGCADAVEGLDAWTPSQGWVWLEGPAGCGKTLLACCAAERLICAPLEWEVELDGEWVVGVEQERKAPRGSPLRRRGGWEVVLVSEAEMFADQRADRNREPGETTTIRRLIGSGVLILDDCGQSLEEAGPVLGQRREFLEQLVDARYRARRPTIFTSNHALHGPRLEPLIGRRAHGRIVEMVGPRNWRLDGDWRQGRG